MAAATNIREKGIREIENSKAGMCQEYGLVNFILQGFVNTEPKLLACLNRPD
jgi:hypothetical protein